MALPALKYTSDRPPLVLVVDDTSDTRDMYAEYLDYVGYRAQTASDGRDAVRRALRAHPNVIVMDLAMPVLDGWEATRILRADPRTKDIPIVVLTGNAQPDQKKRAHDCGACCVLTKPCAPKDLVSVLESVLSSQDGASQAPRQAANQTEMETEEDLPDSQVPTPRN